MKKQFNTNDIQYHFGNINQNCNIQDSKFPDRADIFVIFEIVIRTAGALNFSNSNGE